MRCTRSRSLCQIRRSRLIWLRVRLRRSPLSRTRRSSLYSAMAAALSVLMRGPSFKKSQTPTQKPLAPDQDWWGSQRGEGSCPAKPNHVCFPRRGSSEGRLSPAGSSEVPLASIDSIEGVFPHLRFLALGGGESHGKTSCERPQLTQLRLLGPQLTQMRRSGSS